MLAFAGSMSDSVILVSVRSLLAGKKFLTPEIKPSKLDPIPASLNLSVRPFERELNPRNKSFDADDCAGWVGADEIMVILVISRTLKSMLVYCLNGPADDLLPFDIRYGGRIYANLT